VRWFRFLLSAVAVTSVVSAQNWPVTAPLRVVVQRRAEEPAEARVGVALVWPGPLDPTKCAVYVTTDSGTAVGSRLLWAEAGEPLKILFDASSGSAAFHLYVSQAALPAAPAWEPAAGVIVETRARPAGAINSWTQVRELWKKSNAAQGRSVLSQVYLGHNPHGPSRDYMSYFRATLHAEETRDYELATVSGDASFLFVDGKPVAEWPGAHPPWDGRHGQHRGKVRLTRGPHLFEYYHALADREPIAEAVWRPQGRNLFEVIPPAAFGLVAQFEVTGWTLAPQQAGSAYAEWYPIEHATLHGLHLVNMRFRVPDADRQREYRWVFDDNETATGANIEHLFVRPGLRTVKLEVRAAGRVIERLGIIVSVRPNWYQLDEGPQGVAKKQRENLLARDLAALPVSDLAYLVHYADLLNDNRLLKPLAAACWQRQTSFSAAEAETFARLAEYHREVREYDQAEKACRVVLGFAAAEPTLRDWTMLRLAELLVQYLVRPADAGTLLDKLKLDSLGVDDKRQAAILRADLQLAAGELVAARRAYEAISPPLNDPQAAVRRRAKIESAHASLARGDHAEAERLLREILWSAPVEKLSWDAGYALLRVNLARKEHAIALARGRLLLALPCADENRAELLFHMTECQFALGQETGARDTLARLLKDHPYTEPAARAKDKWGASR